MTPLPASLYFGQVGHVRHAPRRHALRYGMFSVLADIDGPGREAGRNALFSFDRFNLVSVHQRDHGDGSGDLRRWVTAQLADAGRTGPLGRVQLLAAPRVLGLIFNPISVYFCHDPADRLTGLIFEVSNFHGGRCAYPFKVDDPDAATFRARCPKRFFVSPFNPVDGEYCFRLDREGDGYRLGIQLFRNGACTMGAIHTASRKPLSWKSVLMANFRFPLNTIGIVGGILVEAVRLRLKGLTTYAPRRGTIDTLPRRP